MLPVVIPMNSFKLFTFATHRLKHKRLSNYIVFCEFSSLIETLVLCDHIHFFNTGAFSLEWLSGLMHPNQKLYQGIHPYKPFHNISFITELPINYSSSCSKQIEIVDPYLFNETLNSNISYDKNYNVSLNPKVVESLGFIIWSYLSCYVQAYNGEFGEVSSKQYSLIDKILPNLVKYKVADKPIKKDPLIIKAYDKLKRSYEKQLQDVINLDLEKIVIPPITLTLLDRLPNNCSDPHRVLNEILALREELRDTRIKFNELEDSFYSKNQSLKELKNIKSAISKDAEFFSKKWNKPFSDNKVIQFFVDRLSFLIKLVAKKSDIELEDVLDELSSIIPNITERVAIQKPSHLFTLAMKTKYIPYYKTQLSNKLGISL